MKKQDFLSLSETEQQASIKESGKLLINFFQGGTTMNLYEVNQLFVKIITKGDGCWHIEVNNEISNLKLSEF